MGHTFTKDMILVNVDYITTDVTDLGLLILTQLPILFPIPSDTSICTFKVIDQIIHDSVCECFNITSDWLQFCLVWADLMTLTLSNYDVISTLQTSQLNQEWDCTLDGITLPFQLMIRILGVMRILIFSTCLLVRINLLLQ